MLLLLMSVVEVVEVEEDGVRRARLWLGGCCCRGGWPSVFFLFYFVWGCVCVLCV
jgi:hypothetical protein